MRPGVLLQRTSRVRKRYQDALRASPFTSSQVSERLHVVFGDYVHQLPPSLRTELLRPDLQRWQYRQPLFTKLGEKGQMILGILLNDHLGTKNVQLPPIVLSQFCALHRLDTLLLNQRIEKDSVNLLLECVGAVDTFVGNAECREMVRRKILDGSMGMSNLYLEALSNNEL